jgi:hypothetical protein
MFSTWCKPVLSRLVEFSSHAIYNNISTTRVSWEEVVELVDLLRELGVVVPGKPRYIVKDVGVDEVSYKLEVRGVDLEVKLKRADLALCGHPGSGGLKGARLCLLAYIKTGRGEAREAKVLLKRSDDPIERSIRVLKILLWALVVS